MRDNDVRGRTQGECRGDFTRDTFYPLRHFTRVFLQQGRVGVDADWNEQVSLLLNHLRSIARDVGGDHWGPADTPDGQEHAGFKVSPNGQHMFTIGAGHYYVRGLLCENEQPENEPPLPYTGQPDYPLKEGEKRLNNGTYLVYLDVWERHLTYVEDDLIREAALGGPDTATRAKIVWQVKVRPLSEGPANISSDLKNRYQVFLDTIREAIKPGSGKLRARARRHKDADEPCLTTPEARYRGAENQLYRVEIHKGGIGRGEEGATFKWSRDNGSVFFPIRQLAGTEVVVEHLGRDTRLGLREGDWVEVVDDDHVLRGEAGPLAQVISVDRMEMRVTLNTSPNRTYDQTTVSRHPLLRRWDQKSDAIPVREGDQEQGWIDLEDGVQIQFLAPLAGQMAQYRVGDYWLIPARVAIGDVEWPGPVNNPTPLYPHGVEHHYAPLAIISVGDGTIIGTPIDLRRKLHQLWS